VSGPGSGAAELAWLSEVLWSGRQGGEDGRYAVLPSTARPRLLVPLGSRRAGAAAVRGYSPSRPAARAATRLLAAGFRAGIAGRVLRRRAGPPGWDRGAELLETHIEEIMGRRLFMSVFFQTGRPQKKPVLQLITPRGELVGYAKVGWNDLTRRLVRHEGEVLDQVVQALPHGSPFTVPPVRHRGTWRGHELLITGAVAGVRRDIVPEPPLTETATVAALAHGHEAPFLASGYWETQRSRIETASNDAARALAASLESALRSAELRFVFCHGDWLPWNVGRLAQGGLLVWDWEWSRPAAPAGLDAAQWVFQVELNLRGREPGDAVAHAARAAHETLPRLGVPSELAQPLIAMHVVEAILRLEEARAGGVGAVISTERYERAAVRLLETTA